MIRCMLIAAALGVAGAPSFAFAQPKDSANTLTHGMAQMTLRVGVTSQYDVLQTFGGPNVTTLDGNGREVWIYDRFATVTASKDSGFSVGLLVGAGGGSVAGGAGLGFSNKKSKVSTSTRSMILILKFGPDKKLADFQSRSSSF